MVLVYILKIKDVLIHQGVRCFNMKGTVINPNDRILISTITLESGTKVLYKDHTMNKIYGRMLEG